LWVCLLFREAPGLPAVIGGAIILVAVLWHTALDWRGAAAEARPQPA
jgi:hypothetical protein